jgi:molybdate transport system permease protein
MASLRRSGSPWRVLVVAAAGVGLLVVALPLVGLIARTPWDELVDQLASSESRAALRLSLVTSLAATALVVTLGLPMAWVLARYRFPGRRLMRAVIIVPLVMPPVVAGVALLAVFGRNDGIIGRVLFDVFGTQLTFSTLGVVVAEAFVALPFFVLAAESGIGAVDRRYEQVAETLGATRPFAAVAVVLRLAAPALGAGVVVAWARALGEFGATITFAGNIEGRTQTLPLAVYVLLESNPEGAFALSVVLIAVAIGVLVALRGQYLGGTR